MSLLTPTESYALQSFLSQIDYNDALDLRTPDWAMYTAAHPAGDADPQSQSQQRPPHQPHPQPQQQQQSQQQRHANGDVDADVDAQDIPQRAGTEQLAKATKDLMALDDNPERWAESTDGDLPRRQRNPPPPPRAPLRTGVSAPAAKDAHASGSRRPPSHPLPSSPSSSSSLKRPLSPPTSDPPPKKPRLSPLHHHHHHQQQQQQQQQPQPQPQPTTPAQPKPALLSPSQKKANHIQSEQKRRANIRRGYEALCAHVPALRAAIRLEEEEASAAAGAAAGGGPGSGPAARGKKRQRGKKAQDDAEKMDGRAGPRSENVVLQKTIDYVTDLLAERAALLARLQRAHNALGSGHPALTPQKDGVPLWERKWTGGSGMDDHDGDNDSDEDDD